MAQTDGFVNDGSDNWQRTYWSGAPALAVPSPGADAWIRVVAQQQVPGYKVAWDGSVSDGPSVDYAQAGEPLKSVARQKPDPSIFNPLQNSAQQARETIHILYSGVSPRQQDVVYVVLSSAHVRLLNPGKISSVFGPGVKGVQQQGPLLVVQLDNALSMNANDFVGLRFDEGALGFDLTVDIIRGKEKPDPCLLAYDKVFTKHQANTEAIPDADAGCATVKPGDKNLLDLSQFVVNEQAVPEGEEEPDERQNNAQAAASDCPAVEDPQLYDGLDDLPTEQREAEIAARKQAIEDAGGTAASRPASGDDTADAELVTIRAVNPIWPCVPARTGASFNLAEVKVCSCQHPAPVWLVCFDFFGSVQPLQPAPLDKLFSADTGNFPRWVSAVAAEFAQPCAPVSVYLQTIAGEYYLEQPVYLDSVKAVQANQPGELTYKCGSCCAATDVSLFSPDPVNGFVTEDIIKVEERTFDAVGAVVERFTEVSIELPTQFETQVLTFVEVDAETPTIDITHVTGTPGVNVKYAKTITPKSLRQIGAVLYDNFTLPTGVDYITVADAPTGVQALDIQVATEVFTKPRILNTVKTAQRTYPSGVQEKAVNVPVSVEGHDVEIATSVDTDTVSIPQGMGLMPLATSSIQLANGVSPSAISIVTEVQPSTMSLTLCDAAGNSSTITVWTGTSLTLLSSTVNLDLTYGTPRNIYTSPTPVVEQIVTADSVASAVYPTAVNTAVYWLPTDVAVSAYSVPTGVSTTTFDVPELVPTTVDLVTEVVEIPLSISTVVLGEVLVPTGVGSETASLVTSVGVSVVPYDELTLDDIFVATEIATSVSTVPNLVDAPRTIIKPPADNAGTVSYAVLKKDPAGDIELLGLTDCEYATYRFIDRGTEIVQLTTPTTVPGTKCTPGSTSITTAPHETCDTVKLAVPKYVTMPTTSGSHLRAPWYDGQPELPYTRPGPEGSGGSEFATVGVLRIERNEARVGSGMGVENPE